MCEFHATSHNSGPSPSKTLSQIQSNHPPNLFNSGQTLVRVRPIWVDVGQILAERTKNNWSSCPVSAPKTSTTRRSPAEHDAIAQQERRSQERHEHVHQQQFRLLDPLVQPSRSPCDGATAKKSAPRNRPRAARRLAEGGPRHGPPESAAMKRPPELPPGGAARPRGRRRDRAEWRGGATSGAASGGRWSAAAASGGGGRRAGGRAPARTCAIARASRVLSSSAGARARAGGANTGDAAGGRRAEGVDCAKRADRARCGAVRRRVRSALFLVCRRRAWA